MDKMESQSGKIVQWKGSHGQNGVSISKNCPIERLSWTKWSLNQEKLSNRTVLMDKMEAQSGKIVQ
jgi:hypothetical protein